MAVIPLGFDPPGSRTARSGPAAYQERFRLTWSAALAFAVSASLIAQVLLLPAPPRFPPPLRILAIGLVGWGDVMILAAVAMRRVAFRADATGITLGGSPFRYKRTTRVFPWPEVEAVVVWRRPFVRVRYVGIRRSAAAAPLTGRLANKPALAFTPIPGAPPGIVAGACRAAGLWRLDTGKLATAIAVFAPDTELHILG